MLSLYITLTACGGPAASPSPSQSATSVQSGGNFDPDNIVLGGRDAEGKAGVVSSGRLEASQIGVEILQNGGNAIDAAVATGFVLGVCEQQSSGIGGGFMVARLADSGEIVFIDFRGQSGTAASLDMWKIDENGRIVEQVNKVGANTVVSEQLFATPENISVREDSDGVEYENSSSGIAKIKLNGWESALIEEDSHRTDFLC